MEPELGTTYLLEIDTVTALTAERGTDANYKPVVCLTSNGLDIAVAKQTTSNKCDNGNESSVPGLLSFTFTADGQVVTLTPQELTTQQNYQSVIALVNTKKTFWARMTNPDQTIYREGKFWISAYTETSPNADVYTFTATFQGTGELFIVPPVTP